MGAGEDTDSALNQRRAAPGLLHSPTQRGSAAPGLPCGPGSRAWVPSACGTLPKLVASPCRSTAGPWAAGGSGHPPACGVCQRGEQAASTVGALTRAASRPASELRGSAACVVGETPARAPLWRFLQSRPPPRSWPVLLAGWGGEVRVRGSGRRAHLLTGSTGYCWNSQAHAQAWLWSEGWPSGLQGRRPSRAQGPWRGLASGSLVLGLGGSRRATALQAVE